METLVATYLIRPVNIIEIVMVAVCILGTLLVWHQERFRALCLFFMIEAVLMLFNFSEETRLFNQNYLVTPAFTLSTGPAFYLFILHLVYVDQKWRGIDLWHFTPALVALTMTEKTGSIIALGSVSLMVYGVISFRLLLIYRACAHEHSAAAYEMSLDWIRWGMIIFALIGLTDIARLNLQPILQLDLLNIWYFFHHLSVLALFFALIIFAQKQPLLFDGLRRHTPTLASPDHSIERTLFSQIDQCVRSNKWYSKPRLSVDDLAKELGIGVKDISGAVNQGAGSNFCDYINALRVEQVKALIQIPENANAALLEIALECGFNSKSSFNAAFKKHHGTTPSQYRKSIHK